MTQTNDLISAFKNIISEQDAFPYLFMEDKSRELTEDDLQIKSSYFMLYVNQLCKETSEMTIDSTLLSSTLIYIFWKKPPLARVRAILLTFAFYRFIEISDILNTLLTYDQLDLTDVTEDYQIPKDVPEGGVLFNNAFYIALSQNRSLLLNVIKSVNKFVNHSDKMLQFDTIYSFINSLIRTNDNSPEPIDTEDLNILKEMHVANYLEPISKTYPIILPFSIKQQKYKEEKLPTAKIPLTVDRDDIFSALLELKDVDVKNKRLKITFDGETGIDNGNLSKEFVELAVAEVMKPQSDLFDIRNTYYWFKYHKEPSQELLDKYYCFGKLLGIIVNNHYTIPVRFPRYFYKKLHHRDISTFDINLFNPSLFQFILVLLSQPIKEETAPPFWYRDDTGYEIDLFTYQDITNNDDYQCQKFTDENKKNYLPLLSQWIFFKSCEKEYAMFEKGYQEAEPTAFLHTAFRYDEIDLLLSGASVIDWSAFRNTTCYEGYDKNSNVIKWFWKYFQMLEHYQQLTILQSITGCKSIPPDGFSANYCIKIKKVDLSEGPLPVPHSMYKVLDLPEYQSFEDLKTFCSEAFRSQDD